MNVRRLSNPLCRFVVLITAMVIPLMGGGQVLCRGADGHVAVEGPHQHLASMPVPTGELTPSAPILSSDVTSCHDTSLSAGPSVAPTRTVAPRLVDVACSFPIIRDGGHLASLTILFHESLQDRLGLPPPVHRSLDSIILHI